MSRTIEQTLTFRATPERLYRLYLSVAYYWRPWKRHLAQR